MQIHFPAEVKAQLQELALQANQTPEQLVAALVSEKLSYKAWFRKSVDAGRYSTQEDVEAHFALYFQKR